MILEFHYAILIWHLVPDCLVSRTILFMECKLVLLEKWFRHLKQYCFASLCFEV